MKSALALARRGLGNVAPNPAVGCLIVKGNKVMGRGWTQLGGRPHAETEALAQAGSNAQGSTVYVTLEPCAHYGKTPPCAEALVRAGVARVVIATQDPDARVSGQGIEILEKAEIELTLGVLAAEAQELNEGFFCKVNSGRPSFSLKMAMTIDGKIATSGQESKWITGVAARQYGHMLRAQHDAILVGVNTVLADDPDLSCRITGLIHRSPTKIILDSDLRTPPTAKFFKSSPDVATLVIANKPMETSAKAKALAAAGGQLHYVNNVHDVAEVARLLGTIGFTRILVEGGGQVHASFLKANMAETMFVFTAGKIIGEDGIAGIGTMSLAELARAPHFTLTKHQKIGADLLATYKNAG